MLQALATRFFLPARIKDRERSVRSACNGLTLELWSCNCTKAKFKRLLAPTLSKPCRMHKLQDTVLKVQHCFVCLY